MLITLALTPQRHHHQNIITFVVLITSGHTTKHCQGGLCACVVAVCLDDVTKETIPVLCLSIDTLELQSATL